MSKIVFAKMQLLKALQQGRLEEANVLLDFVNKYDPKAKESETYKELGKMVPIAKKVEEIEEKIDNYYQSKGMPNPYVDYEEDKFDEDGYESYNSEDYKSEEGGEEGEDGEDDDEEQEEEDGETEEESEPELNGKPAPPATPSLSEASTAPTEKKSHQHHHCCEHK